MGHSSALAYSTDFSRVSRKSRTRLGSAARPFQAFSSPSPAAWWRHDIETLSASLPLCEGNPPVTGGFPSQRASDVDRWSLFSLLSSWTSCMANSRVARDLKCHDARVTYNVYMVMKSHRLSLSTLLTIWLWNPHVGLKHVKFIRWDIV